MRPQKGDAVQFCKESDQGVSRIRPGVKLRLWMKGRLLLLPRVG